MATGTATFGCIVSGMLTGQKTVQWSVALSDVADRIISVNSDNLALLQPGDNTILVPSNATFAVIEFPLTPETVLWKGDAGDVGTQMLSNTDASLFCVMLVKGLTSFILNATDTIASVEVNFL